MTLGPDLVYISTLMVPNTPEKNRDSTKTKYRIGIMILNRIESSKAKEYKPQVLYKRFQLQDDNRIYQ